MAVIINGTVYSGNNLQISGNKIIIDGKDVTPDSKEININVTADIQSIEVDCCNSFIMKGNAGRIKSTNGNIEIDGNVSGDVETTNGNIRCGSISGSVKTKNGNIRHQ